MSEQSDKDFVKACNIFRNNQSFSRSMFASDADLYKAKSEYFESKYKKVSNSYNEIIMAVATKFPDESRHETALRYINNAENHDFGVAQEVE